MYAKVKAYIKKYEVYQEIKADNRRPVGKLQQIDMQAVPWQDIAIDLVSGFPCWRGILPPWWIPIGFKKWCTFPLGEQTDGSSLTGVLQIGGTFAWFAFDYNQ